MVARPLWLARSAALRLAAVRRCRVRRNPGDRRASFGGRHLATGGGFFRMLPAALTNHAVRQCNKQGRPGGLLFPPVGDRSRPAARGRRAAQVAAAALFSRLGAMRGKLGRPAEAASLGPDGRRSRRARCGCDHAAAVPAARRARGQPAPTPATVPRSKPSCARSPTPRRSTCRNGPAPPRAPAASGRAIWSRNAATAAIAGVLPLTEIRSPIFGAALVSTGFGTDGGILAEAPGAVAALASGAWALGRSARHRLGRTARRAGARRRLACAERKPRRLRPRAGGRRGGRTAPSPSQNRRATVRKAMKQGFTVTTGNDARAGGGALSRPIRNRSAISAPRYSRARLFREVLRDFGDGS